MCYSATMRSAIAGLAVLPLAMLAAGPADAASSARKYFSPDYLGQPVAFCLDGNRDCGRPAAAAWCQANGYDDAISFARRTSVGTAQLRYADTGNLCDAGDCIGFSQIKCIRSSQ